MVAKIKCQKTEKEMDAFFLNVNGKDYYLFSQAHRAGVYEYYKGGVLMDNAVDFTKSRKDKAICRTMTKLPLYVKYIESYYGLKVLRKTLGSKRKIKLAA